MREIKEFVQEAEIGILGIRTHVKVTENNVHAIKGDIENLKNESAAQNSGRKKQDILWIGKRI